MNPEEHDIEPALRQSPRPQPPSGLRQQLIAQIQLPKTTRNPTVDVKTIDSSSWFRRLWPILAPATISIMCVVVMGVQHAELRNLEQSVKRLSQGESTETEIHAPPAADGTPNDPAIHEQQDISRLKELAKTLAEEIEQLEKLKGENVTLQAQLDTQSSSEFTPQELEILKEAKEKALSAQCINNLRQFGLAVRQWAVDNQGAFPPDVISMKDELKTPKILHCPTDENRPVALMWSEYSAANSSYEYLGAGGAARSEQDRVLSRCPLHGHVGLFDGSVQAIGKSSDHLVKRDGKLYYK